MGRQWLYREISEHLTSDLPTNRGVIVAGNPATGKTAAILQLVENRYAFRHLPACSAAVTGRLHILCIWSAMNDMKL